MGVADVFVSYSRRDSEFVHRLAASVSDRGKDAWLDTEGIADGEVFPEAIKRAIEGADTFLFVITPNSVASPYCENEVEHARVMHKRIVPVLRAPVEDSELPSEIRDRNWIPFTEDHDYDASVSRLIGALDADLEAARAHTRWLVKALEWDGEARDRSFLLRGSELKAAESWLAACAADADPAATPLQREYLLASARAAARRQRAFAGASVVVAVISIGLLIFALISRGQAVNERVSARAQALAAESQAQLPDDPEISLMLGIRAVRARATPESLFALRSALDASPLERALPTIVSPGSCAINSGLSAAYSPDGRQIAEGDCEGVLQLLDAATGLAIRSEHPATLISALAYSPSGSLLALGTATGVTLVDPRTGAVTARLTGGPMTDGVAYSPNGRTIAADNANGITVWGLPEGRPRTLVHDRNEGGTIAFSHDGRLLIVGGTDASVHIYDAASGRLVHRIVDPGQSESWPEVVALNPDGSQLAVGYPTTEGAGAVSIYSTHTWRIVPAATSPPVTSLPQVEISSLAFSPDGARIAVGAEDGTAGVWSVPTDERLATYDGPTAAVTALSFSRDGHLVLSASNDGIVRLWRAGGAQQSFLTFRGAISQVVLNGDTLEVPQYARAGTIVWSVGLPDGSPVQKAILPGAPPGVLSPDGRFMLSAVASISPSPQPVGAVDVWNVAEHRIVRRLAPAIVGPATFSYDDSRLALIDGGRSDAPGPTVVETIATGRTLTLQHAAPCGVNDDDAPVFSRDGRRVANAGFCGYADVWDASTGRLVRQVDEGGEISAVDLSADGSRLLVASWDSRATIWNVATGKAMVNLIGHTRGIDWAGFSPDGSLVITAGLDDTVRIWNARTGQMLRILSFADSQGPLAFSADGRQVAIGDNPPLLDAPGIVRVFDTCPACESPHRLLTLAEPFAIPPSRQTTLEKTVLASG
jgi:WD40 repeat protein